MTSGKTEPVQDTDLRAAQALNERIIQSVPGGIVHVTCEGAIASANDVALDILGMSYDAITRRYVRDWDPQTLAEDGSPFPAERYPVSVALGTGKAAGPATIGVVRPDGKIRWGIFRAVPVTDAAGKVTGAVVSFVDITERKRMESKLRESEELLRSIVESAPNMIMTVGHDERILYINHTIPELTVAQVLGRSVYEFLPAVDHERVRGHLSRILKDGMSESWEVEGVDGRWYSVAGGPLRSHEKIIGATIVTQDQTTARELQRRLTTSDRMASVGTLAAGVAHELNNPLTYVLGNLQLAERRLAIQERGPSESLNLQELKRLLEGAVHGGERIRDIVRDLSTFSRSESAELNAVAVQDSLEQAITLATYQLRHRAQLVRQYSEVPRVRANGARLSQVFLNLLVNAAQAIPEGNVADHRIRVKTFVREDARVVVEVSDTGAGMEPELLARVFEPFVTTKGADGGTGLGLYICHNIVDSLGGSIEVSSRPGHGTTFSVALVPAGDDLGREPSISESCPPPSRGVRLLVVDDEPLILRLLAELLPQHRVTTASNGREAIATLTRAEFDLILCDVVMPDLTGLDVYQHVAATWPGLEQRLIFMTGGAFTQATHDFLASVANPCLQKPFKPDDLEHVIKKVVGVSGR